jgi:hypothetical protein
VRRTTRAIGFGRLLLGGTFLAAPVPATRILGLDTATAKRVSFLARMMAARDVAIGAGTAGSGRPRAWLLAGAFADATDAAVLAAALRSGRARGPVAMGVVGGAAVAAAVATAAAVRRPG